MYVLLSDTVRQRCSLPGAVQYLPSQPRAAFARGVRAAAHGALEGLLVRVRAGVPHEVGHADRLLERARITRGQNDRCPRNLGYRQETP